MRDPIGTAYVGKTDCSIPSRRFPNVEMAQDYLYEEIGEDDPVGLDNGDYFIDVVTEESLEEMEGAED